MAKGVKTGGRKPGSVNKTTAAAKEAFRLAFEGLGGVDGLINWGMDNQTAFYQLYSKLIPIDMEVSGKAGAPAVQVQIVKSDGST